MRKRKAVKWICCILPVLYIFLFGCSTEKVEKDPLSPDWAADYRLDELGYYNYGDVSDEMIEDYILEMKAEGFWEIEDWQYPFTDQVTREFIRDDAWINISYPRYDNWYQRMLGYKISIKHDTGWGGVPGEQAAAIIEEYIYRKYGTEKNIVAILDRSPEKLGDECNLRIYRCILKDAEDIYVVRNFLVGEKSMLYLWPSYHILHPETEGEFKDKVILLRQNQNRGAFTVIIQLISAKDSDPEKTYGYEFWMDQGKISLREKDGKIYFVHAKNKIPLKQNKITEYEKAKEYEILLNNGVITIQDPHNELNILDPDIHVVWDENEYGISDPYDLE